MLTLINIRIISLLNFTAYIFLINWTNFFIQLSIVKGSNAKVNKHQIIRKKLKLNLNKVLRVFSKEISDQIEALNYDVSLHKDRLEDLIIF